MGAKQLQARRKEGGRSEMLSNVRSSTASALEALRHLERSLVQGHFAEGVEPYKRMCSTLLGQKIWSLDKNDPGIDANFDELARLSKNVIDLMQPYVMSLEKLSELGEQDIASLSTDDLVEDGEVAVRDSNPNESMVLDFLKGSRRRVSFTRLKSEMKLGSRKLGAILDGLRAKGEITVSEVNGRKVISPCAPR